MDVDSLSNHKFVVSAMYKATCELPSNVDTHPRVNCLNHGIYLNDPLTKSLRTAIAQSAQRWAAAGMPGFNSRQGQHISLLRSVQTCLGPHPASDLVSTGGKAAGA
jgi:hypothetical protein